MSNANRWVVDSNVFLSFLLSPRGTAMQAVSLAARSGNFLFSHATFMELEEVLARPKFSPYFNEAEREQFLEHLANKSIIVDIYQHFDICRDPKDNMFLDLAYCGHATAILTGDADLLSLKSFLDIPIYSPSELIAIQS